MWICCVLVTSAIGCDLAILSQDSVVLEKRGISMGKITPRL